MSWIAPLLLSLFAMADHRLVDHLESKGFSCTPATGGNVCKIDRVSSPGFSYDQPISILVPDGLRTPSNISLFLHGSRGICPGDSGKKVIYEDNSGLLQQLGQADPGHSSIMILPSSPQGLRQINGRFRQHLPGFETLTSESQFPKFVAWMDALVQSTPADRPRYHVTGFSLGGKYLDQIVANNPRFVASGRLASATFLDATYHFEGDTAKQIRTWREAERAGVKIYGSRVTGAPNSDAARGFNALQNFNEEQGNPPDNLQQSCLRMAGGKCVEFNTNHCRTPQADFARLYSRAVNVEGASPSFGGAGKSGGVR